jgi:hypothetical protein
MNPKHPLRRQVLYLLRTLAYLHYQFPDDIIMVPKSVEMDFTTPDKATGFANIYKGKNGEKIVAVKEIKLAREEQYVRRTLFYNTFQRVSHKFAAYIS